MDIALNSSKKNFDIFLAFAPAKVSSFLERYENAGDIFINANVSGKTINGHFPTIEASFGYENAYIDNKINHKKLKS